MTIKMTVLTRYNAPAGYPIPAHVVINLGNVEFMNAMRDERTNEVYTRIIFSSGHMLDVVDPLYDVLDSAIEDRRPKEIFNI